MRAAGRTPPAARARLASQQIAGTKLSSPKSLVAWMVAMQAQDFPMSKWAVGVRLPACTEQDTERALAAGEIIRTHLLRPTWHMVSADDLRWLLALTGPRIKASLRSRHRQLELTDEVVRKSHRVIEKTARDGQHPSREAIIERLRAAGIPTDENRASHLLLVAELDAIVCSGPTARGRPTYALVDERVPAVPPLPRDEALAALARRYFTSRCPAARDDFAWWSGLAARDVTRAMDLVKEDFHGEEVGAQTCWVPESFSPPKARSETAYLLPAYDEYTLSYRDRSAAVPTDRTATAVSRNGIFYPLVIHEGRAVGTWKRIREGNGTVVRAELFGRPSAALRALLQRACRHYSRFLQVPVRLQA